MYNPLLIKGKSKKTHDRNCSLIYIVNFLPASSVVDLEKREYTAKLNKMYKTIMIMAAKDMLVR